MYKKNTVVDDHAEDDHDSDVDDAEVGMVVVDRSITAWTVVDDDTDIDDDAKVGGLIYHAIQMQYISWKKIKIKWLLEEIG